MLKWMVKMLILVWIVAVALVFYQTPSLRAKVNNWAKAKAHLLEKRWQETKELLAQKGVKKLSETTEQAQEKIKQKIERITQNSESSKPSSEPSSKPSAPKPISKPSPPPMQEPISEKDRAELEKILEKAEKISPHP